MGDFLEKIGQDYKYVMEDLADERTKGLPLLSSPLIVIVTSVVYLIFCTRLGPYLMSGRKAFELRNVMKLYNIFQIVLSGFLTYQGGRYFYSKNFSLVCDPIRVTDDPIANKVALMSWWYLFAKVTELLDTVLFVLRKKSRQISTLHLYHHTVVLISAWISCKYFPGGPIVLVGTLNSMIHILMYGYYFVSGLGPKYQKYLWWKQYLTLLQIIQFIIIIAHNTMGLFNNCNYPKSFHLYIIVNTSYVMYMFSKFYYNSYIKPKPKKAEDGKARKEKRKEDTKLNTIYKSNRKIISVGE